MKITLYQVISDETIEASVRGETLTINGEEIDLSVIPDGYRLPASAVSNRWFVLGSYIERIGGHFNLTLCLPVHWDTAEEIRAPKEPIVLDVKRGKVKFPNTEPVKNDQP